MNINQSIEYITEHHTAKLEKRAFLLSDPYYKDITRGYTTVGYSSLSNNESAAVKAFEWDMIRIKGKMIKYTVKDEPGTSNFRMIMFLNINGISFESRFIVINDSIGIDFHVFLHRFAKQSLIYYDKYIEAVD